MSAARKRWKLIPQTGGIEDAVSTGMSELTSLAEECREVYDNAGDKLQNTQRITTLGETADTLEGLSEPTVPEGLEELKIDWHETIPMSKRRQPSRATRRDNAVSALTAAKDAAQTFLDDDGKDDEGEISQFIDDLDSIISDAEGVEFPGMYG